MPEYPNSPDGPFKVPLGSDLGLVRAMIQKVEYVRVKVANELSS